MPKKNSIPCPKEHEEQKAVFEWATLMKNRYPELKLLHHIPNGGLRNKVVAMRLTQEGVKSGVPDICLPVPKGQYHGLYIEMKRIKGGRVETEQREWLDALSEQGYSTTVCRGAEEAVKTIQEYLKL